MSSLRMFAYKFNVFKKQFVIIPFPQINKRLIDNAILLWYTVTTMKVNIRKARENFSRIVNTVAIKGERVVLLSKNKPKAAIVSLKDLEKLESASMEKRKRLAQIEKIRKIRDIIQENVVVSDSSIAIKKMREDRIEKLSGRN